jgi:hypothetical protein
MNKVIKITPIKETIPDKEITPIKEITYIKEIKEKSKKWKEYIINNDKNCEEGLTYLKNFQYERCNK